MTQEEIIKLANTAGFNWSDIQATTIEQRLERFASLVAATEREKFANTQEFVTLPREVVEQALEAMTAAMGAGPYKQRCSDAEEALRAALEQTKCEQEPYAWHYTNNGGASAWHMGPSNRLDADMDAAKAYPKVHRVTPLYTQPQPRIELTGDEARRIYSEATYHASLAVFMTRMDAEHPDADDKGVSGWLQEAEDRVKRRITEAAHEIVQAAAPQQGEQEPVAGVVIRDGLPCLLQDRHIKSTDHRVYTHPQPPVAE